MDNIIKLTIEQTQVLLNFSKQFKEQGLRAESIGFQVLPEEILGDLETTSQNCTRGQNKKVCQGHTQV
ncbi:hypothetical protein BCV72DRAFT_124051 [Rhizopus microsporus var. microsporus]|uniref:Uncharacterized protein n=1 Tax=Rhizopus microsporus var. microsporus TaxID=86635 RepID=A0A1X0R3K5_RHIZD|nr:hypothetical protein BCV72DRAFT_124051 [Rhizopus microsporus var. microsporus]